MPEPKKKTNTALIVILVIIGVIVVVGVIGCVACSKCVSDVAEEIDGSGEGTTSSEESPEKTYKKREVAKAGEVEWTVTSAKKQASLRDPNGFMDPKKASGVYIVVNLKVKNMGKEAKTADSSFLVIVDSQGREFEADTEVAVLYLATEKDLFLEQLNPNVSKEAIVVFDIDKAAKKLKLRAGDLEIVGDDEVLIDLGL